MSEISKHSNERQKKLFDLCKNIVFQSDTRKNYLENIDFISTITSYDIVEVVHQLFDEIEDLEVLKKGISQFLNLFHKTIVSLSLPTYSKFSIFTYLMINTNIITEKLNQTKSLIQQINKKNDTNEIIANLKINLEIISKITDIYVIKENILFPKIEKEIENYKCILVMWSVQEDVRKNLKKLFEMIDSKPIDLKLFNQYIGRLYFDIFSLEFRDKYLLYPYLHSKFFDDTETELLNYCKEMPFPFSNADYNFLFKENNQEKDNSIIDLETGKLTLEQIELIFNNIPVDITFVDENDKVRYFSSPKNRVFPRTTAIIGRDVRNCHPPESVGIVEKIIDQFKTNKRNEAIFWINFKQKYLLISYFAVRDANNNYKGIIEVTQEIQDIVNISGEKRLLDENF